MNKMIFLAFIWVGLEFTGLNISSDEDEHNSDSDDIIADAKKLGMSQYEKFICITSTHQQRKLPLVNLNRNFVLKKVLFMQNFCNTKAKNFDLFY